MEERFITHSILVMPDVVVVLDASDFEGFVAVDVLWLQMMLEFVVTVNVLTVEMSNWLLLFECPTGISYLYPLKVPKEPLLYMYPFCLSSHLLCLDICVSLTWLCWDSLTLWIKECHSSRASLSLTKILS